LSVLIFAPLTADWQN